MMLASIVATQVVEDQIFFEHSKEGSSNKTFDNYHRQSQRLVLKSHKNLP